MGFFRHEYWSGLSFPSPGDLPNQGSNLRLQAVQADSLPTEPPDHRRTVWRGLKTLKVELPCEPAIPLLGIYLKKTLIWKDTCISMFIAPLFIIVKTEKQCKCPSTESHVQRCNSMDCSQPGSSVHGILQARILNCVAVSFFRGFSWPMDRIWVSCIAGGFFGPSKPPGRSLLDKRVYQPDLEERERELDLVGTEVQERREEKE